MSRGGTNAGAAVCPIPVGMYIHWDQEGSPAAIYPNTIWERYTGSFLFAATDENGDYPVDSEGGETTVTLSKEQIPKYLDVPYSSGAGSGGNAKFNANSIYSYPSAGNTAINLLINSAGGNPHNNMPPYLAAYCWKRIA